ncbi:hypothetical protein GEV33_013146 [Tenebrio molitor]|uniref:Uncharacterized protein n=1 Tax=Tenebrio molitor TaxID=7067 RepID=A0A8J6H7R3_TENMO|nr:hypothetical protein GEV33_013146 [Tenebrio molitor]
MYYVLEISCIEVSLLFLPHSRHAPKEPTIVFASVDTRELSEAVPTFLERTGLTPNDRRIFHETSNSQFPLRDETFPDANRHGCAFKSQTHVTEIQNELVKPLWTRPPRPFKTSRIFQSADKEQLRGPTEFSLIHRGGTSRPLSRPCGRIPTAMKILQRAYRDNNIKNVPRSGAQEIKRFEIVGVGGAPRINLPQFATLYGTFLSRTFEPSKFSEDLGLRYTCVPLFMKGRYARGAQGPSRAGPYTPRERRSPLGPCNIDGTGWNVEIFLYFGDDGVEEALAGADVENSFQIKSEKVSNMANETTTNGLADPKERCSQRTTPNELTLVLRNSNDSEDLPVLLHGRMTRGFSTTVNGNRQRYDTVIFGLLDGPEGWQRRTISTMAFGNPPSGMIADPERHARDSQLATCGTAARSAVADRASNTKDLDLIPLGDKASRKELAPVREEKGELGKELAAVRKEMRRREEKWQAKEADWMERMKMIEEKMEQRKKKERKNNVITTGIGGIRGNEKEKQEVEKRRGGTGRENPKTRWKCRGEETDGMDRRKWMGGVEREHTSSRGEKLGYGIVNEEEEFRLGESVESDHLEIALRKIREDPEYYLPGSFHMNTISVSLQVDENLVSEGVRYLSTLSYRFYFFFYPVCSHSESKCRIAVWASAARLYLNMQNGVPEPPPPDN